LNSETPKPAPDVQPVPGHAKPSGVPRLHAAFLNSMAGLRDIWRGEQAFRIEAMLAVVAVPVAFWLTPDAFERAILIASVLGVMLVEVVNSAIEATVDRIGAERHEKSRVAKDLGSLAVLVAAVIAAILWSAAAIGRFAA
jgi:diacylglycerol kinase (ATP)